MENNQVHLIGTVKRNAEAGSGVMDFAIVVTGHKGRLDIFDCRLTARSAAYDELEGFVTEGERIEVIGHLERRTTSDEQKVNGVTVIVRKTDTVVFVDSVIMEDEQ